MPTLEFKGKSHIYAHHLTVPYRPLQVDESRSMLPEGQSNVPLTDQNLIIHGDNLQALKALLPHYGGRVKCIYIDPPYNTGKEGWAYNDRVNSPLMRDWFAKNSPVDGEDLERHDKWLCMMWPRLHLLKELLAEDGAIFVSIDDNEVHHLRMLMDEIFGEGNFIANVVWRKKVGGGQDSEYLAQEHDYVLSYRKNESFKINFRTIVIDPNEFKKGKNGRKCKFIKLEKWGAGALRTDRPTMFYPIKDPDGNDFYPQAPSGAEGRWRMLPERLDHNHIHWEKRKGRWTPLEVVYFDEAPNSKIVKDRTIFYDIATTTDATNEQKSTLGEKMLDNSKPVGLVRRLLELTTRGNTLVLDSFAGSGTTAHAVLAQNKADGGNRRFILIECEDYADSITAERVRRVIRGVPKAKDRQLREGLGGSFAYCALGQPIDIDSLLTGENLPTFSTLAAYLLYTATGVSAAAQDLYVNGMDGHFYADAQRDYYLIYEPNLAFLRGSGAALNMERVKRIRGKQRPAMVFAPTKYISQRQLSEWDITFCQLPYELMAKGGGA